MTKITNFGKPECRVLRDEIDQALKAVAEKYGISLKTGNMKYSGTTVEIKVAGAVKSEDGTVASPAREAFLQMVKWGSLPENMLDQSFRSGGKTFKVTGYNGKAYQYPIQAKCLQDNKNYKFPVEDVKRLMGIK